MKKIILKIFFYTCFFSLVIGSGFLYFYLEKIDAFKNYDQEFSELLSQPIYGNSVVFDRHGKKLGEFFDHYQIFIPFEKIPKNFVNAVVATEDRNFWTHDGIDKKALVRMVIHNLKSRFFEKRSGFTQGGSTITQQLARELFLTRDKKVSRKIKEIFLARQMEKRLGKEKIIELYLNKMFLGANSYGVAAASHTYFNKKLEETSLSEAALICGLFQLPSAYNPLQHPERSKKRQKKVLTSMYLAGYITKDQARDTFYEKLVVQKEKSDKKAPYFLDYVKKNVAKILKSKLANRKINSKGFRIHTTLDFRLQTLAEKKLKGYEKLIDQNKATHTDSSNQVFEDQIQAAMLSMDPSDGGILAMIGGRDYTKSKFNRATSAGRAPGSSFKPFVFTTALEAGMRWSDMLYVSPMAFKNYRPKNYSNEFLTETTMLRAFYRSINTPTLEVMKEVGVHKVIATAKRFGFTSPLKKEFGLALGSSQVSMLELAGAYSVFANGGHRVRPFAITRIEDSSGLTIYQNKVNQTPKKQVLSYATSFMMTKAMENVLRNGTGHSHSHLASLNLVGKTGTSNDSRDNWFCGYGSKITTLVWLGSDKYYPIKGKNVGGSKLALPLWDQYMSAASKLYPSEPMSQPHNVVDHQVNPKYGYLSRSGLKMYFMKGQEPIKQAKDSTVGIISKRGSFRNVFDQ